MSINPVLAEDTHARNELCPLPQPGEVFVLKRDGISFVASNSDRKLSGRGKLFLTNRRLVFLRDGKPEKHKGFTSIELPLHMLQGSTLGTPPVFKQPIFGANYLEGKIQPVSVRRLMDVGAPHPLASTSIWSLTFNQGGCQTFLHAFYRLHKKAIADPTAVGLDPNFSAQMQMGPQRSKRQPCAVRQRVAIKSTPTTTTDADTEYIHNILPTPLCFICRIKAAFFDPGDPSVLYLVQPTPAGAQLPQAQHHQHHAPTPPSPSDPIGVYPSLASLTVPVTPPTYDHRAEAFPLYQPHQGHVQNPPPYVSYQYPPTQQNPHPLQAHPYQTSAYQYRPSYEPYQPPPP